MKNGLKASEPERREEWDFSLEAEDFRAKLLQRLTRETARELSDEELTYVAAAGDPGATLAERMKKNE